MSKPVLYLKRTYIVMRKRLDERLSDYKLTTSQFEVLGYLYQSGGLEQQSVQHLSGITSATLTGILDKMEERGFVVRTPSRTDGRANVVELTEQGHGLFTELVDVMHDFEDEMLRGFTVSEREALARSLERITRNLGDD